MSLIDKKVPKLTSSSQLGGSGGMGKLANLASKTGTQLAAGAAGAAIKAALGIRFDPVPDYLFAVELDGIAVGLFTECSGVAARREVDRVEEGGLNNYTHSLPGRMHFSDIVLKRGLTLSRALWNWMQEGSYDFKVRRMNFSIIQGAPGYNLLTIMGLGGLQKAGAGYGKAKVWNLENAYPVAWELSELNTQNTEQVALESITIAHHGIELSYQVGTPLSIGGALLGN